MKYPIFASLLSVSLAASASATAVIKSYTTGFSSPTFPSSPTPAEIAGHDGWVISDSTSELSFLANIGNGQALALGGTLSSPANASVSLSHAFTDYVGAISAHFDFAILDSTDAFPTRDSFGFSLNGNSGSLFAVTFRPVSQTANPDNDSNAKWAAFYSVNGGSDTTLNIEVEEQGKYSFDLKLLGAYQAGNTTSTNYTLDVSGLTRTGNIALAPQTSTAAFAFNYITTSGAANAGDNFIGVDNLSVVPEPSSSLLLALTGLGLVLRRRRA